MNAVVERHDEYPAAVPESNNPFAVAVRPAQAASNAISEATQAASVAEVQAAMVIAQRFPRSPQAAWSRIEQACQRPSLAEQAVYAYSRGGSEVTGPSIRLAEALAQAWGNIQFGVRELDQREGESTVEAFAWDLETNTKRSIVFQVGHERHTKRGVTKLTDPRDIYETVANQGARRLRACILAVIPGDVTDGAVRECNKTLHARVEVTDERRKAMLDTFAGYGVKKEHIEKRIQRTLDSIAPAQFLALGRIANSLRDGMSSPSDWFEIESTGKPETAAPQAKAAEAAPKKGNGKKEEAAPAFATPAQIEKIEKLADVVGCPPSALLKHFDVADLRELPFAKVAEAMKWLEGVG